jgi:sugar phosphate isomerase/epimerase
MPAAYPPLPSLPPRTRRAWRLGSTSYVHPDDILPNAESLAGQVEDIELVLFESPESANLPSPAVVERLAELGHAHGMTYSIHLPIDRDLGDPDPAVRRAFTRQALRILDLLAPLPAPVVILHLQGIEPDDTPARVRQWQDDVSVEIERLLAAGVDPRRLCVENLRNPFEWNGPVVERFDLSVCVDVGHLWLQNRDAVAHLRRYLPRVRAVHLHGERDGKDHLSLAQCDPVRLRAFVRALDACAYDGLVSLEVFSFDDTATSIDRLKGLLP